MLFSMIMSPHLFYKNLKQNMNHLYPSAQVHEDNIRKGFSPFTITLPLSVLKNIKKTVKNIYFWSRYLSFSSDNLEIAQIKIKNHSVLMAYDFHLTSDGQLKLIEINTNASGFLVTDIIQKTHGRQTTALDDLKYSFFNEWSLFTSSKKNNKPSFQSYTKPLVSSHTLPRKTAIVDENIENQKMKFEFFMYHDLMNSWNWNNEVLDVSKITLHSNGRLLDSNKKEIDFIYNRLTDFYFKKWNIIQRAYRNQKTCFSPNPREYALLADKKKLCSLTQYLSNQKALPPIDSQFLKQIIAKTYQIESNTNRTGLYISKESAWKDRKKFFFKPLNGFGGKATYRGSSITKTKMAQLKNSVAQEYIPPQKWLDPIYQDQWKFDIRAYAYKDQVQLTGVRIYKGQLTNFSNPLGGFGHVVFQ